MFKSDETLNAGDTQSLLAVSTQKKAEQSYQGLHFFFKWNSYLSIINLQKRYFFDKYAIKKCREYTCYS